MGAYLGPVPGRRVEAQVTGQKPEPEGRQGFRLVPAAAASLQDPLKPRQGSVVPPGQFHGAYSFPAAFRAALSCSPTCIA